MGSGLEHSSANNNRERRVVAIQWQKNANCVCVRVEWRRSQWQIHSGPSNTSRFLIWSSKLNRIELSARRRREAKVITSHL